MLVACQVFEALADRVGKPARPGADPPAKLPPVPVLSELLGL